MKRSKKTHLTADDCKAFAQSREGSSSLTQPLSQRQTSRDVNRGLYPTHRTKKQQGGQAQQKNITDYFKVSQTQQVGAGKTNSHKIKEDPLESIFTEADESFSSVEDPCSFLEDDVAPAPRASTPSRKRTLSAAVAGSQDTKYSLWGEPEKKPLVVHPAHSQIEEEHSQTKQELDDMEIEPIPDTCYGLLGTRNWDVPQGSIDKLPTEVLRRIFAFLPVSDLYQSLSLVCHSWKQIVSDPLFIPWKKLYHRYVMKEDIALISVGHLLKHYAITKEQEGCVVGMIRCVSAIHTNKNVDPSAALLCLESHHLFPKAAVCIASKVPHLQSSKGPQNMWAIVAAMVLFSDGVRDIQKLMACLWRPSSTLSFVDVTEALYCIATLLYAMRERGIAITNRIHYNIFHCLYLMENDSVTMEAVEEETPASCYRQDLWAGNCPEIKLTHEQQRILNHKIERGQVVKIVAFAGTGKTSTLIKYAEKFADLNFLYVTFNKAVAERGKHVFPKNVTCKTFHSLAFGSVGKLYKEKGKLNFSKLSAYSVSFLIQHREGQSLFIRGKTVKQTLENFFASSDEEISEEHTPVLFKNTHAVMHPVSLEEKKINVQEAKDIWYNMKKLDGDIEKNYKITCDGYLKLWQLSKPQLTGYDAIFVDEAQDCTPAIMDIVLSQSCGIILVGDPHQQIYTFRGAVNTLYTARHTHVYYLTQSFRFGAEIAYVGATILDVCKRIRNKTLVGGNQEGDVRGSMEGKITVLSRSNFNVFDDAVRLTGRERPIKIHVIGGLARFGLSKIHDIWKLYQPADERKQLNLVINDPFLKKWEETQDFTDLRKYAEYSDDKELEVKIAIVEKYRERIPELVQRIESSRVSRQALADYLIGTVHQAKGLEFDTVLLADDFVKVPDISDQQKMSCFSIGMYPEDEWNLLYVAVTRAKKCLLMSKSLERVLALAKEHFLRVELMSEAVKEGTAVTCSVSRCQQTLRSSSGLVVKKLPLTLSNGSRDEGGYLCCACARKRLGSMAPLIFSPAPHEEFGAP
ncbi:F-box DNA helicase 1 isoform X2 [Rhea pennata]|uniref:F-box DNA helicase 1 isoform X2 n=1 Tax=Rhea pennata TaxID=8795 RepID=UPI002E26A4D3